MIDSPMYIVHFPFPGLYIGVYLTINPGINKNVVRWLLLTKMEDLLLQWSSLNVF